MRLISPAIISGVLMLGVAITATTALWLLPPMRATALGKQLSSHTMPLTDRYPQPEVNTVFKENILLTLSYLSGKVNKPAQINWQEINKPFSYEMTLKPGEVFAFHDTLLPEYTGKTVVTTHAHFDAQEGFVSDGYLFGDGVCHLASLINWAARDAGLQVNAPTPHDFAAIADVPAKYGTAIYTAPGNIEASELQNLYVENTFGVPVKFVFNYLGNNVTVSVFKGS